MTIYVHCGVAVLKQHIFSGLLVIKSAFVLSVFFLIVSPDVSAKIKKQPLLEAFQMAKKKDWLAINGEEIWIGTAPDRTLVRACRKNKHAILYLKSWGIASMNSGAPIIYCPRFFSRLNR